MSADEDLGYIYIPTGSPTQDAYGGHRLGWNLFANSLLCLDSATGRLVWYFQAVHHDLWDYDLPAAPNIVDLWVNGEPIKAVAQITKQGFVFVFDRISGVPIWPIEERVVPRSNVPGERAAVTQPFPTRPPPFEPHGAAKDDLVDFTPGIRQLAVESVKLFTLGPLYTPPTVRSEGNMGTLVRPGISGAANWYGAAVDPSTGILYVPSVSSYSVASLYEQDDEDGIDEDAAKFTHYFAPQRPYMAENLELFKPPYSRLTAIDLNQGVVLWTQPLGDREDLKSHPELKTRSLPVLGGDRFTGPLVTKTLLVIAQYSERSGSFRLVARDKVTGEEVGAVDLPGRPLGTPMSYMLDGRQYIVLSVSSEPPELVAFALDEAGPASRGVE